MNELSKPAVLGGDPAFASRLNIVKPDVPSFGQLETELRDVLSSGMLTKGQHLVDLEAEMAKHLNVAHVVAVSSCTTGLILAMRGLGLKGEIITPSFTFLATVTAAVWAELDPVFADVDYGTTNLDPASVENAISERTSAIIAVHNFGNPASIDRLQQIAAEHKLRLIFDAAHGFGSLYGDAPVGGFGDVEVFSMSPTKLVIGGEGGIVATNDGELAENIRIGREYGMKNYDTVFPSINARMPEINALIARRSLERIESAADCRNRIAQIYRELLGRLPGISFQNVRDADRCSYKDFAIMIDEAEMGLTRNELAEALLAENIDVRKYYDPPVHRHTAYTGLESGEANLANTERLSGSVLSLPIWSSMDEAICEAVAAAVTRIANHASDVRDSKK